MPERRLLAAALYTTYDIERAALDLLMKNPDVVSRRARIVPSIKNGRTNGFKLYALRPGSIYVRAGFMNGDTVHSLNGHALTTPDRLLEIYDKVKLSAKWQISITRRGKPVMLDYTLR